jgi:protein-S-isoprenylcysteine O-methyltransferase Ste14
MQINRCIEWIWAAVGAVWMVSALAAKKTARRQAAGSRLLHIAIITVALLLLFPRLLLGGNWSGSVTLKRHHQLVRRGPYNILRHPIHSHGRSLHGVAVRRRV